MTDQTTELMNHHDVLLALARAIPAELRTRESYRDVHRYLTEKNPGYYTEMITTAEAARMIGVTQAALRQMRFRGQGPPGYLDNIPGLGPRYMNRLVILEWIADHYDPKAKVMH